VTGTSAADWKGASLWDLLLAPFGVHSAAWNAVNEVTAAAGDLIVTGVGCSADPVRGPLVLRCTCVSSQPYKSSTRWRPLSCMSNSVWRVVMLPS